MYILSVGTIADGLMFYGPFKSSMAARLWADMNIEGRNTEVLWLAEVYEGLD